VNYSMDDIGTLTDELIDGWDWRPLICEYRRDVEADADWDSVVEGAMD